MDRRNLILGCVAGVLILVAIVYYARRPSASAEMPREIKASCACLACGQHVRIVAEVVDVPPYDCPDCGEQAAYPLYVCRDCGKHSVPNLMRRGDDEFPSLPVVPSCTACGSANVGAYTGSETIPSEELVLPAWP